MNIWLFTLLLLSLGTSIGCRDENKDALQSRTFIAPESENSEIPEELVREEDSESFSLTDTTVFRSQGSLPSFNGNPQVGYRIVYAALSRSDQYRAYKSEVRFVLDVIGSGQRNVCFTFDEVNEQDVIARCSQYTHPVLFQEGVWYGHTNTGCAESKQTCNYMHIWDRKINLKTGKVEIRELTPPKGIGIWDVPVTNTYTGSSYDLKIPKVRYESIVNQTTPPHSSNGRGTLRVYVDNLRGWMQNYQFTVLVDGAPILVPKPGSQVSSQFVPGTWKPEGSDGVGSYRGYFDFEIPHLVYGIFDVQLGILYGNRVYPLGGNKEFYVFNDYAIKNSGDFSCRYSEEDIEGCVVINGLSSRDIAACPESSTDDLYCLGHFKDTRAQLANTHFFANQSLDFEPSPSHTEYSQVWQICNGFTLQGCFVEFSKPNSHTNALNAFDATGDGKVTPLDALTVINAVNQSTGLGQNTAGQSPYLDVSQDGHLTPLDALMVINYLNNGGGNVDFKKLISD